MRPRTPTSEDMELLALRVLARHHVGTPPVNVDEIANAEGLDFVLASFESLDGNYIRDDNDHAHAMINRSTHRLRQRFTKAHELGHHLIDERQTAYVEGMPLLRLPSGYRGRDRHWAHERFAAALLMPRTWVGSFIRERGWQLMRDRLIIDVARSFDVSRAAAEIRLVELGHIERGTR